MTTSPSKMILVESHNPRDLGFWDIAPLALSLADNNPDCQVALANNSSRTGPYCVTWVEVLNVWLPEVAEKLQDKVVGATVALIIAWAKRRFASRKRANRPKSITIYGPTGKPLCTVSIPNPDDPPEIRKYGSEETPPRNAPPVQRVLRRRSFLAWILRRMSKLGKHD